MDYLKVTDYKGIRVLTTQQIAEAYETTTDTITKNFNRNKKDILEENTLSVWKVKKRMILSTEDNLTEV